MFKPYVKNRFHLTHSAIKKTMLQYSKLVQGRKEWREKAIQRGYQIRELRKKEKCHLARIAVLKQEKRELIQANKDIKKNLLSYPQNQK